MRTVVAIYTGQGLADPLKAVFTELMPDCRLVNIIDDGLIHDINAASAIKSPVIRRLIRYYENAAEMGADVILNTCSSVGEIADLGRHCVDIPIIKIDEAMAKDVVHQFVRIGVIATLRSTLEPTKNLIVSKAKEINKEISLVEGLAAGAFDALISGQPEKHDELIVEATAKLANEVDVIVLAQGSMARMQEKLQECTGKPVRSSIRSGLTAVKSALENAK